MTKVRMETKLNTPADTLWKTVGGFNALPNWHPGIAKSETSGEGKGSTRTLSLAGGGSIVERLEEASATDKLYRYSILSGPCRSPITWPRSTSKITETARQPSSGRASSNRKRLPRTMRQGHSGDLPSGLRQPQENVWPLTVRASRHPFALARHRYMNTSVRWRHMATRPTG